MTTKDLHIAIKRNDGMEYLLSKFAFSEETELFETIRKIVPVKAEEFIKILKKKQKKFGPKVKNIQIQVLPEDMNTEVSVEVVEQDSEEKEGPYQNRCLP